MAAKFGSVRRRSVGRIGSERSAFAGLCGTSNTNAPTTWVIAPSPGGVSRLLTVYLKVTCKYIVYCILQASDLQEGHDCGIPPKLPGGAGARRRGGAVVAAHLARSQPQGAAAL